MTGTPFDALAMLKEYGLAGVMAWLFWWTLRRMMFSQDAVVRQLKDQLSAQAEATQSAGERFAQVVENHLGRFAEALAHFERYLDKQGKDQRSWQRDMQKGMKELLDRRARRRVRK